MMLTHLSLCTGIGGIDLAAEWAGFTTVGQCEIDEYASKVLTKNFKGVPNLHDIRTIDNTRLREHGIDPDAITLMSAGFPCQPYSLAGKGRGDGDERDLWGEVKRCIGEIKPRWFVGENTPGLFARANQRYFKRILADLAEMGYNVSWGIWGACDVGAPHKRDRVFLCAFITASERCNAVEFQNRELGEAIHETQGRQFCGTSGVYGDVSDADNMRQLQQKGVKQNKRQRLSDSCKNVSHSACERAKTRKRNATGTKRRIGNWETEPDVGRVANGVSARVDKLRCLGNAVVPQQIYPLLQEIADYENRKEHDMQKSSLIKITCDIPADADEKCAGGLWDLAGELGELAGNAHGDPNAWGAEYGQEEIYNRLRELCDE